MSTDDSPEGRLHLACVQAREVLVDDLARRGFDELGSVAGTWRGPVRHDGGAAVTVVDIVLPGDFPYTAPKVKPLSAGAAHDWGKSDLTGYHEVAWSWHREPTGRLCLFELDDHSRLPWAEPAALFTQLEAWLDQDLAGWPQDEPALDLERYFESTREVVLFDNPRTLTGVVVQLRNVRRRCRTVAGPAVLKRGKRGVQLPWPRSSALVLDVGVLTKPVLNWPTLVAAAGSSADRLITEVGRGVREVLVCYRRGENNGVLAVQLTQRGRSWALRAHTAAPDDPDARLRRSHPRHTDLSARHVTILGVGAIGSAMADLLHRSGVGHLELVDPDTVLPGNAVRHLAGMEYVGEPKVTAVKDILARTRPLANCTVTTRVDAVTDLTEALDLLSGADVVVDATADSTASALLAATATAGAGHVVSVAVLAGGYAIRVDHWPAPAGGPLPEPILPPRETGTYEAGCSSPVSTTPPAAVWEAAALGARHTIDALLGQPVPAGEEHVLRTAPPA